MVHGQYTKHSSLEKRKLQINIIETADEQSRAFQIRHAVFVLEQKVPAALEIDEHEATSIHFIGYDEDQAVAASRVRFVEGYGKLERICILKKYRGKRYGKQLIQAMETEIKKHGYDSAKLNAQTHAEEFYQRLGYKTTSEPFSDAGIPHIEMIKLL